MRNAADDESSIPNADWTLSPDDRVLIRAIALVGDVVTAHELDLLCTRWAWAKPMSMARVQELEGLGVLTRAGDGWYVTQRADALVGDSLGMAVQSLLMVMVGGIVCEVATDLDRFRLGLRRVRFGGDDRVLVSHCRRWAASPAGKAGPRGEAFVEAMGLQAMSRGLRARVAAAVPAIHGKRSIVDRLAAAVPWTRERPTTWRDAGAVVLMLCLAGLAACAVRSTPPGDTTQVTVAPAAPEWYVTPTPVPGLILAPTMRSGRTLPIAVERAELAARGELEARLQNRFAAVAEAIAQESGDATDADLRRRLRAIAESTAVVVAAAAGRRDYLVVPRGRGFDFFVLAAVDERRAARALAAAIEVQPAVISRVRSTETYRGLLPH